MDPNIDNQQGSAVAPGIIANTADDSRAEMRMIFEPYDQDRPVPFNAVFDPESRCSVMPKGFLEQVQCLDEMIPMPAIHNSDNRPHERVGVFWQRISFEEQPDKTFPVTFCVVEDVDGDRSQIYIGRDTLPADDPAPSSLQEEGVPIGPVLSGKDKGQPCDSFLIA